MAQPLENRLDVIAEDHISNTLRAYSLTTRWQRYQQAITDSWNSWLLNEGDYRARQAILETPINEQINKLQQLQKLADPSHPPRVTAEMARKCGIVPESIGLISSPLVIDNKADSGLPFKPLLTADQVAHYSITLQQAIDRLNAKNITPKQVTRLGYQKSTFDIAEGADSASITLSFVDKLRLYFDSGQADPIDAKLLTFSKFIALIFFVAEAVLITSQQLFNLVIDACEVPFNWLWPQRLIHLPQNRAEAEIAAINDKLNQPYQSRSLTKGLKALLSLPLGLVRLMFAVIYKAGFEVSGENQRSLSILRAFTGAAFSAIGVVGALFLGLNLISFGLPLLAVGISLFFIGVYYAAKLWTNPYPLAIRRSGQRMVIGEPYFRRINLYPQADKHHRAEYVVAQDFADGYTAMDMGNNEYQVFSRSDNKLFWVKTTGLGKDNQPIYDIYSTYKFGFWDMWRFGHRSITLRYKLIDGLYQFVAHGRDNKNLRWQEHAKLHDAVPNLDYMNVLGNFQAESVIDAVNKIKLAQPNLAISQSVSSDAPFYQDKGLPYYLQPDAGTYFPQIMQPGVYRPPGVGYEVIGRTVESCGVVEVTTSSSVDSSTMFRKPPEQRWDNADCWRYLLNVSAEQISGYRDISITIPEDKYKVSTTNTIGQLYDELRTSSKSHKDCVGLNDKCIRLFEMLGVIGDQPPDSPFSAAIAKAKYQFSMGNFVVAISGLQHALKVIYLKKLMATHKNLFNDTNDFSVNEKQDVWSMILKHEQHNPDKAIELINKKVNSDDRILTLIKDFKLNSAMKEIQTRQEQFQEDQYVSDERQNLPYVSEGSMEGFSLRLRSYSETSEELVGEFRKDYDPTKIAARWDAKNPDLQF